MMGPLRGSEPIDQQWLDRLADGDLSEEEERAVMARLADTPDGWQRCAWTFLEHRCWQRAASALTCASHRVPAGDRAVPAAPPHPRWKGTHLLALAATFLVALGVGLFVPRTPFRAANQDAAVAPPGPAAPSLAAHTPADVGSPWSAPAAADDLYVGDLRLVNDSGKEIDVPVYDWDQRVAQELLYHAQPLPTELVNQLKRHQVRSSRSFLPVQLQDGRHVVLPVQEVDITPVGGVAY
ncbi:MAG: hypothetical protein MUF48_20305 [Pirellulaceae bacterium]|jgi:hypothetical protein|nr:hypothetical protein [Pirellulaceae bacterium]